MGLGGFRTHLQQNVQAGTWKAGDAQEAGSGACGEIACKLPLHCGLHCCKLQSGFRRAAGRRDGRSGPDPPMTTELSDRAGGPSPVPREKAGEEAEEAEEG